MPGSYQTHVMSAICAALLVYASLTTGHGPGHDLATSEPASSKSENGFSAILLMSDNPEEVVRDWDTPNTGVTVRAVNRIPRGVPIVGFVFFSGCRPDEKGNCNASVDFRVVGPDGSEYVSFRDRDLWKHKPAPPPNMLRLAAEYVGVVIEPEDLLGEYEFHATIHDLNGGTTLELRQTFIAIESGR